LRDKRETVAETSRELAQRDLPPGTLYVVATPLGNLGDLTYRARDVLAACDVILAEDTRVTGKLLAHYRLASRATALHAHNEAKRTHSVLAMLASGKRVALVSDAGTPAISDPGARLVRAVHEAGFGVVPIAGPSAVAAAVSAAGLVAERFVFIGFLPVQAKARHELLATFGALPAALVLYEAPHRVRETVAALASAYEGRRTIVLARELTKRFEEVARLPLSEALQWLDADENRSRGEFVLVVDAPVPTAAKPSELTPEAERWLRALLAELPPAAAARIVATASGVPRSVVYARAMELRGVS
jgi:16S rRNA (cytidine1402-2'-O)-methyltransferase